MPIQKIEYAAKRRGDLWTATDANEVKEVVNNNADILSGHDTSINTINNALDSMSTQLGQNTQTIRQLSDAFTQSVWLTQAQYDALVDAGTVNPDIEYNIYEE
ncbi:MAG: hypothetical protein IKO85_04945 [Bacteroidaceae bacterium]|nr:hypothetical protein [Bacteroidaceae bacterium]